LLNNMEEKAFINLMLDSPCTLSYLAMDL